MADNVIQENIIYLHSVEYKCIIVPIPALPTKYSIILTPAKMPSAKMPSSITADQWLEAAAYRRSCHGLAGTSKVSDERVQEIVAKVLSFAPSSYNTQPVRITLAFGEKHKELWSIILEKAEPILKSINPALWEKLGPLFQSHKAAYGSVSPPAASAISWLTNTRCVHL